MKIETLRSMIGPSRFNRQISADLGGNGRLPFTVDDTATEPSNDGLTLDQGREALKIASESAIELPKPSVLFRNKKKLSL